MFRVHVLVVSLLLFGVASSVFGDELERSPRGRPNILIITADNLGYGDLRCYNPRSRIPTPNFDRLSGEGARLTGFYTASPTCTVSRASLLTGRIPQRHGLVRQLPGVEGNYGVGLAQSETLIPQVLKQGVSPYVTGCFGKWNIGFSPGSRPTERGFDEFVGHASGNMDYFRHNYRDRHDLYSGVSKLHREGEYSTNLFANAAIDFIERHSKGDQPWFCYVPFNAPHFPSPGNRRAGEPNQWQAPEWAFEGCDLSPDELNPEERYRAVVYALDHALGRVLDCLKDCGVEEETFVFFMSDNGSFRLGREGIDVGINHPLRAGGVTCWEGGLRVAAMARFPGEIEAGVTIDDPLWSPDLLVACAKLAQVTLPADREIDGVDPLPVLFGETRTVHRSFVFEYKSHAALRMKNWKIVREASSEPWQLYDLGRDQEERRNLAGQFPETVNELVIELTRWRRSF
ncbi:MAG: sulfatase-like hydrolase/transferase [Verrucomicrobia bacterium]|jgi:arylsulfatase A|nr:sulfatase-like hydrolase/transferase [Verrucomicrobiota bacterium]